MKRIYKSCIILFAVLFFVSPVFAQEAAGEAVPVKEGVMFAEDLGEGVVTGKVTSLDASLSTVTLKLEDGKERTFFVVEGDTILWRGIEDIEFSDIKKGREAEIGYYTDEDNRLIASWVDVLEEELEPPVKSEAGKPAEAVSGPGAQE